MTDFRPLPLLGNSHVQTLLGTWLKGPLFSLPSRERHVLLPDGDRLVLHDSAPPRWTAGGRVVVLVHGLSGSHRSSYMGRLAGLLLARRLRVVRMDLRGCGRGIALARRSYHAGCSDDVRAALAEIHRWSPASPVSLIGVSLGGNIVLKLAGEASDRLVPGLERVAALGPPADMVRCAELLAQPRNRFYDGHFARELIRQAQRRQQFFPDLPPVHFPRQATVRLFDELYTAPRHGFADALDYYRRTSSLPLLPRIIVPTLILTARDDPFIAAEPFEAVAVPEHVRINILPRGGHIGFLGWDGAGGIRWAERSIAAWLARPNAGRLP